jgi:nucleoside 2-deoxyribosyltransferase
MARFNTVEFYRKALAKKPLSVAAPRTRYAAPPTAQLSTIGHLFDKGAPLIADYITGEREKSIRSKEKQDMIDVLKDFYGKGPEAPREVVEGERSTGAYWRGGDASVASEIDAATAPNPSTDAGRAMLIALTEDRRRQKQEAEAAALKRSQDLEDWTTKARITAEYREPKIDKYGTPFVVADQNSSTGYSRVQINQAGAKRTLGEAASPTKVFDPDAARKESLYSGRETRYDVAMAKLNEADEIIGNVNQMWNLVQNVDSGSLAEWGLEFKKLANNFGFTFDKTDIANAEAMRSKGMDFILQRIEKTKGAISEKEMTAFKQASASLANTRQGNEMILNLSGSLGRRMKLEAEAVRAAYAKNPTMGRNELDDIMLKVRINFGPLWAPPIKPPENVDPATWYNMSEEQQVEYTRLGS